MSYTGVSWAIKLKGSTPDIRVIKDWPTYRAANATSDKFPTSISYVNNQPSNWGFCTNPEDTMTFQWFKLLLEPNPKYATETSQVKESIRLLQELNRTAEQVAGDYLRFI